jgi:Na+-transporting methylmalonyl-CoA/oxaloacetate decarboxylase gamma subunit
MNEKKDFELKSGYYLGLAIMMIILLFLMLIIFNLSYFIKKKSHNLQEEDSRKLEKQEKLKHVTTNPTCLIISTQDKKSELKIVEDSLNKTKISYMTKASLEDFTTEEIIESEIIIINGNRFENVDVVENLIRYQEKNIIFMSMPNVNYIKNTNLKKIMGIKNITQSEYKKGIEFLPGFLIGGLIKLPELKYSSSEVELLSTTKTYVIGSDKSPIIWRNIFDKTNIYMINGPFAKMNAGYGILTAIIAQIYPDYIYPVVNAKLFTYSGFPYISNDNTDGLIKTYNRNAMQLQHDILIPDILSINKSRNLIPNGFLINTIDNYLSDNTIEQINNYEKNFYKNSGEVGIRYSGNYEEDNKLFNKLFNKDFKLLEIDKEFKDIDILMENDKFNLVEAVCGSFRTDYNFSYITNNAVYIPYTIEGVEITDLDKLEFYSYLTAFGMISQNINFEQIIYPSDNNDNWINVSRKYIKFIDSYRDKFTMIKSRNITEMSQLVKKYNLNSPRVKYFSNKIIIKSDEWYGELHYILRTNKEIDSITNAIAYQIEEGVYLVSVHDKEAYIFLKQIDKYSR